MEFKKMVNNPRCKTEKETLMYRTDFWTLGEGEGGMICENSIETCILSSVQVRVGCMRQVLGAGALGRSRGMGWGEGFGMGNTCKYMADSCQCMAKTTTIL